MHTDYLVLNSICERVSERSYSRSVRLKGNRNAEMSVSNALTALTKANQVVRKDGKYVASMG
jgi:hypothetical protein